MGKYQQGLLGWGLWKICNLDKKEKVIRIIVRFETWTVIWCNDLQDWERDVKIYNKLQALSVWVIESLQTDQCGTQLSMSIFQNLQNLEGVISVQKIH